MGQLAEPAGFGVSGPARRLPAFRPARNPGLPFAGRVGYLSQR
jgi:hypothetical protein